MFGRIKNISAIILEWPKFNCIAIRVSDEELWIAGSSAAIADCDAQPLQSRLRLIYIGDIQCNMTVVARRVGMPRHLGDAH